MIQVLRKNAELEIIGDGPLRKEYEKLITSLNLQNVVRLLGNIPHNSVFNEFDSSNVFVFISEENFSVAAVEAMSRGLPLVVSESTGIPELIVNGVQGFVIKDANRMDSKYVASVLKKFVSDPQIIQKMSDAALELSRNLTWEKNAYSVSNLISKLLK